MEALHPLLEQAGPIGGVVAAVAIGLAGLIKAMGWTAFGDKSKVVAGQKLERIDASLGEIKQRVGAIETDLKGRPTRQELHDLELSFTRMEGRFQAVEQTVRATNSAVGRIEDHMIRVSERVASKGA